MLAATPGAFTLPEPDGPGRGGDCDIGRGRLAVIAGPCVIETAELCVGVAHQMRDLCRELGLGYVFKASFDKANRTSLTSPRGPGLERGLAILAEVRREAGVPVLTDIHESCQAEAAAAIVDMLQIPAFLARQTDLLVAAARTGKPVNLKKAQFMAPWDVRPAIDKLVDSGCPAVLLTERGVSFGYNTLVVDVRSLPIMRGFGHPVCLDVTHSMQQPSGLGGQSGATREYAPHLARAAVAAGVDALFIETHPFPELAQSDAAAQLPLSEMRGLLQQVAALHRALKQCQTT